jgi:hypothetical protein
VASPRLLRPDEAEIVVLRELRKAGLEISAPKVLARPPLSRKDAEPWTLTLEASMRVQGDERRLLIECRSGATPVDAEVVRALRERLTKAGAAHVMIFSTSGFTADAVRMAREQGIPLLLIADGPAAFARGGWGAAGAAPAWVPEYMAEVLDLDAAGQPRPRLIEAGRSDLILDRLARTS